MRRVMLAVGVSVAGLAAGCGGSGLTLPGSNEPAQLTIVGGDGQQGPPGEMLADPLVVSLQDVEGRPVTGVAVRFQFTDALPQASLTPDTASTDSAGRASARVRLGQSAGVQAVDATVAAPGEDLRVRFRVTAVAAPTPDPGGGGGGSDGGGGHGRGHHD